MKDARKVERGGEIEEWIRGGAIFFTVFLRDTEALFKRDRGWRNNNTNTWREEEFCVKRSLSTPLSLSACVNQEESELGGGGASLGEES